MEALKAIFTRRSIRKYTNEPITQQAEDIILKAGMNAANTLGQQAWAFVVVRDKARLADLSAGLHPNAPGLKNAAMAIVVCGDRTLEARGYEDYWTQDCSAAAENILLAAHAIGLGAVWLGGYPDPRKVRALVKTLELPMHIDPLGVIALGHPAEVKADISEDRFERSKIHYEKWNGENS